MSDTPPEGCSPESIAQVDQALVDRGWRILRRIKTPDRVMDWLAVDPEGQYWLLRAIWPPPGHAIGLAEVSGMLDAMSMVPGWSGWLLVDGEVEPAARAMAGDLLCLSTIEAIFPQEGT